jgi:hypothetical protein
MTAWAFAFLVCAVMVVFVIIFGICRKDSVCAAVWFRRSGFFLDARNNESERKTKIG